MTSQPSVNQSKPAGEFTSLRMRLVYTTVALTVISAALGAGILVGRLTAQRPHAAEGEARTAETKVPFWTCSMHPQIRLPGPGQCPICFMDLIPAPSGGDDDAHLPRITLSPRARQLARVETTPVARRTLEHEIRLVGKVTPDETLITYVASYIPGRLDRLFVDYTGILVNQGDHLAEIYSPDLLVAQQEYLVSLDTLERAQDAAARRAAREMLDAARRKLELWGISSPQIATLERERRPSDHMQIDAPHTGWVIERQAFQGMYVETGTRLFTLADLRTVWVQLEAYEMDMGFLRLGQEVQFESEAFPGQIFHARISYIDPVLDPQTRTVNVRVVVPNEDLRLRPEMFVRARVKVRLGEGGEVLDSGLAGKWLCPMHPEVVSDGPGTCRKCGMELEPAEKLGYLVQSAPESQALVVPQTAVLLTGTRAVVYVESQDQDRPRYEGRVVELGPRAGEYYIVRSGLQPGERVVTRGAIMIDSALQIQAKPSMMQMAAGEAPAPESAPAAQPDTQPAAPSRAVAGAMYHQHMAPVIDAYLAWVTALAADDVGAAVAALGQMRDALGRAAPHGLASEDATVFQAKVAAIASGLPPADAAIEPMRESLPGVTAALEDYLRTFGHNRPQPIVEAFCPMAFRNQGARWLQVGDQINNPYFGSRMLRCGQVQARIAPDGKVAHEH